MTAWEQNPAYLAWAESRLNLRFDPAQATWLTSLSKDGRVRGVAIFSRFHWAGLEVSVVGEPGWITKDFAKAVAAYVWLQCKAKRVTAIIADGNEKSLNLAAQLGFRIEGHLRGWYPSGDAKILGLLREDCKFLRALDGLTIPAAST